MIRFNKNPYFKLLPIIFISIIFFYSINNLSVLVIFFNNLLRLFTPLLIGAFIAYFLNPIEKYLISKFKLPKWLTILIVYIIFLFILISIIFLLIPTLIESVNDFTKSLPYLITTIDKNINDLGIFIEKYSSGNSHEFTSTYLSIINDSLKKIASPEFFSSFLSQVLSIATSFFNVFIGIILSVYMLIEKDKIIKTVDKVLYTIFNENNYLYAKKLLSKSNSIFSGFITGKTIASTIIGLICFLGLSMLGVKYALIFSIFIGVTNMIPYFGPIIGGMIVSVIVAFYSFFQAISVAAFILILQQFDSLYLTPKVIGDRLGSSPLLIIASVLVGGHIGGVLGLFLGIPIFATIKFIFQDLLSKKYSSKKNKTT